MATRLPQRKVRQKSLCFPSLLSRLHADGPIKPDDLSIEEWVLDYGLYQMSILSRVSKSGGEWYLAGQEVAYLFWEAGQQWGAKQA